MNITIDTPKLLKALLKWGITVGEPVPVVKRKKKAGQTAKYTTPFLKFWSVYPRPEDKTVAYKSWCTLIEAEIDYVEVIKGAKRYAEYCKQEGKETKHIKLASTFLNNSCYENTYNTKVETKKVDKAKVVFDRAVREIVDGYDKAVDKDGYWQTIYDKHQDQPLYNGFEVVSVAKDKIRRTP